MEPQLLPDSQTTPFLQQLKETLEDNYTDSTFNVFRLSQLLDLCPMQLYRKVKHHTGLAPGRYVLLYRMQKSWELLRTTNLPVSQVAWKTGFDYHHTFSRAFRRVFGYSPRHMRELLGDEIYVAR